MGLVNLEDVSPIRNSPPKMLSRGIGESRRKVLFVSLTGFFILFFLVGSLRKESVKGWVDSKGISTSIYTVNTLYTGPKPPSINDGGPVLGNGRRKLLRQSLTDLRNETLGFGNIFVINMEERPDKLDAMRLSASLTGFKFEVQPGINGSNIPAKALPGVYGEGREGVAGCYRSHMDFAQKIIENNLATALVMEDDADWDVSFRSQLEFYALGTQTLLKTPKSTVPLSPYGDGWDLLFLGHCATQPTDDVHDRFVMKNDPRVLPKNHRTNYGAVPDVAPYGDNSRTMFFSKGATCTYAYALSFHGAQKILEWLALKPFDKPIDYGLHEMCGKSNRNFTCISSFPQLVGDHKPAGSSAKDSDIVNGKPAQERKVGYSNNVMYSTRLNADALIDGRFEEVTPQWAEDIPVLNGPIITEYQDEEVPNVYDPTDDDKTP